MSRKKLFDLLERAGWTAAQVLLSGITVEMFDLDPWLIVPIATALSSVKSYVASKVGNTNSVSTLPASLDPATPGV